MLLKVNLVKKHTMVHMEILGKNLACTIIDGESKVNILPKDTQKSLGKPIIWPPTFQLVGANQQGIKVLRVPMAQKVLIGTQPFLLNFVVIYVHKKTYNAL